MNVPAGTLDAVVSLCRRAAAAILEVYEDDDPSVDWKVDRTPVTAADRASHDILDAGLRALHPALPVISEEGDPDGRVEAARSGRFWLVDPLDGTREFLKRTGEFTVNVALVVEGRPLMGVVQVPATGRVYAADLTGIEPRAWRAAPGERPAALSTRPVGDGPVRVAASRDHAGSLVDAIEARDHPDVTVRRAGSSLKFCLVASGEADLYLRDGRTMEWDTAAADSIVQGAGGVVVDMDRRPLRYGSPPFDNPPFVAVGDPAFDWKAFTRRMTEA